MSTKIANGGAVDPFARYALPLEIRDGVEAPLPGTPAVFRIAPMSAYNEVFQTAVMSGLPMSLGDIQDGGGNLVGDMKPADFVKVQRDAFIATCILSAEGLPDGMDATAFFKAYPFALNLLFQRAREITEAFEKRMAETLGNSIASSAGTSDGAGERTNTKSSPPPGSSLTKGGSRKPPH